MQALITGGTGFLGGALARRLVAQGVAVTVLGRNGVVGQQLQAAGMRFVQADLVDATAVAAACAQQDVVFHCGAAVAPWGRFADFYATNVTGTEHVIQGCMAHNVARLVHVSTPSIYFAHADRLNVGEYDPLPAHAVNAYADTKLIAERLIERAYRNGLPVITIRPRAIFGPDDTTIFPRVLAALRQNRLRMIGRGDNIQDLTYIENVVDALLLCWRAPATTLGKKYNITNGEPILIWAKLAELCTRLGYPFPKRRIPFALALGLAGVLETTHTWLGLQREPPLTRYAVSLLAKSMTLDISAARRDLGYIPRITVDEGLDHVAQWWKATQP